MMRRTIVPQLQDTELQYSANQSAWKDANSNRMSSRSLPSSVHRSIQPASPTVRRRPWHPATAGPTTANTATSIAADRVAAVDVVLPVQAFDHETLSRIEAWLGQTDCFPIVHLVMDRECGLELPSKYCEHPDIRVHHVDPWSFESGESYTLAELDPVTAAMVAAHRVTEDFETPFLAFACQGVVPAAFHLSYATQWLVGLGHEWYAASMQMGHRLYASTAPSPWVWRRSVLAPTAVVRRSLWVDLCGIASRSGDADIDFFDRAAYQERSAAIRPTVVCQANQPLPNPISPDPRPHFRTPVKRKPFQLHTHGVGFPTKNLKCDVVLPFLGQLDFVQQAIDSVLAQENIDLTLHLIDDATTEEIDPWLRRFLPDCRVRIYRNSVNVGQFISFNNIIPHVQSDWIATQDGDDMSFPDRLSDAVSIGQLCNADLVAGASLIQGPEEMARTQTHRSYGSGPDQERYRYSFVPRPDYVAYFLENPTIVHRKDFFVRMNGFADLAHPLRNRTSVDSEYMLRALYSGANIVTTRRLSVIYRVHEDSAIRREETKMGSPIRNWAQEELIRRVGLIRRGGIDPRTFGSLGRSEGVTQPWNGG